VKARSRSATFTAPARSGRRFTIRLACFQLPSGTTRAGGDGRAAMSSRVSGSPPRPGKGTTGVVPGGIWETGSAGAGITPWQTTVAAGTASARRRTVLLVRPKSWTWTMRRSGVRLLDRGVCAHTHSYA